MDDPQDSWESSVRSKPLYERPAPPVTPAVTPAVIEQDHPPAPIEEPVETPVEEAVQVSKDPESPLKEVSRDPESPLKEVSRQDRIPPSALEGESKYSQGRRSFETSNVDARVYAGNLSYDVGWKDLADFMAPGTLFYIKKWAGVVVHVEILTQPGGIRSKGCGIVEFEKPQEAKRAITELNERSLLGRPVFIREDREKEFKKSARYESRHDDQPLESAQLFVGNLPYLIAWQDLKDLFREIGKFLFSRISFPQARLLEQM